MARAGAGNLVAKVTGSTSAHIAVKYCHGLKSVCVFSTKRSFKVELIHVEPCLTMPNYIIMSCVKKAQSQGHKLTKNNNANNIDKILNLYLPCPLSI